VRKGLDEIDPDDYESTLRDLAEKKNAQEREADPLVRKQKLLRYLLGKATNRTWPGTAVNGLAE
jgi:regulatory protein